MASINTFVQDSKLKFRRIYDTKKVTMNDFTRNAIEKRVGCNDNKGIKCIGKNMKVCDTQYNVSKCNNLADRFKDEFGSFVYPSGITGPFLDKFIVFMKYLDNNSINNLSLTQLENLNTNNNFGFNRSQLQIIYSYFESSNYIESVTPPPVIFDKFYNSFSSSEQVYDIGDIDIYNTSETDYYYAIASEQDRTQQTVVEYGLKGPIEFILGTSGDPKKTTYYYTVDDWETTRIFTDNVQQDQYVFITLKIHETDYLSGNVNLHFYSIEEGFSPSPIMTQKFIIKNIGNITKKPAGGKRIVYYIEYLSNWFDINPTNYELIPPFTRNKSVDPYSGMMLNKNDKEMISLFLRYLKSYKYTGPTSVNRTKLALPYGGDVVENTEAGSYTYGPYSTNKLLNGVKINNFIKNDNLYGTAGIYEATWFSSGCLRTVSNDDTGGEPARDTFPFHGVDRVSFRMNGNNMEMKTSKNCKITRASYILNASERDINTRVGKNKFGPVKINDGNTTNKLSYNLYTDPSGNGSVTHDFGAYISVKEWTPIATFLDDILNEDIGLGQKAGFPIKPKKFFAERIVNVKILVTDYCEADINDLYSRITPRTQELNITPTFGKVNGSDVDYDRYGLEPGGYAAFLIKRLSKFKSQVHPVATDYTIDDLYRLGARFDFKLLKGEEAEGQINDTGRSWQYKSYGIEDDIQFYQSDLIHEVRYFERICYVKPNTDVYWNFVTSASQGLRGLAIDAVRGGPSTVGYIGGDTNISYWQGVNFLENYYNPYASNSNLANPKKSVIYSLPGVDKASDMIGWKIVYKALTRLTKDDIPSKDATYTINYVYNDVPGENEDYDPETFYLGFASFNIIGTSVKIYNSDAGFLDTEVASGYRGWDRPYFISPETIPSVPDEDLPYMKPIEMSKYNPDTVSVIATDNNKPIYVRIISDEYLKTPWDHSLIKSEISYGDDT